MHAGQDIAIRLKAATDDGKVVRAAQVTAEFWAPGKDPRSDPGVRAQPDYSAPCEFDGHATWTCRVPTDGWQPGTWTVRGLVQGREARGWAFQTFTLAA